LTGACRSLLHPLTADGEAPLYAPVSQTGPILDVREISRRLGGVAALDGVSLSVEPGQVVCLVGPSGCGKSTLLRTIAGVEEIDSGTISITGQTVAGGGAWVEPEHRMVGFMVQDYALFPHLTARQNIRFGLRRLAKAARADRGEEIIERLGIRALADRYPHQLSGGEQQRIALARALAPQPSIVLMDEPFSNLDPSLRDSIRQQTLELIRSLEATAIIVTHDPEEALSTGDLVALMHEGKIAEMGTGESLYRNPKTPYAAGFFSQLNRLPAKREGAVAVTALGAFPAHQDLSEPLELLVRPQALMLGQTGIPATVVDRAFLGEFVELKLAVEGLESLLVLRTGHDGSVAPGQSVRVGVKPGEALLFGSATSERAAIT
jgi:iron(III) transport system ATP-binding protein